jgi:CMP/dCMP kinase
MTRRAPLVAIDGPAGAGKSTVARRVAQALDYLLLDTGALYRCVALAAQRAGATDPAHISAIAEQLAVGERIRFEGSLEAQRVLLDGEDVSLAIRTSELGTLASKVSAIPGVRAALLEVQRRVGREGRVIVEGRDIGSVVFPDAEAKFFLTASVQARAVRRFEELKDRDGAITLGNVENEVRERDRRDSSRPVAPLLQAPDAELLDSTSLTVDAVVLHIVERVRELEAKLSSGRAP